MKKHRIEYEPSRKHDRVLWAWFDGTSTKAMNSAHGLLRSLIADNGYKRARVWLNDKRVKNVAVRG